MEEYKEITKTLQILLWVWFGTITSFTAVNVANIVKLEAQIISVKTQLNVINDRMTIMEYNSLKNK